MTGRTRPPIAGLYAVTPDLADTGHLIALVEAALAGGAALVQYRNKTALPDLRREQGRQLARLCERYDRPLIVNDHLDDALAIDGAGLHVGADDFDDVSDVRRALGPGRLLGVSCYADGALADRATAAGADYIAFGSVFASPTKRAAKPASLALFRAERPVAKVGIGGITRTNLPSLVDAGADAAAVISDLFPNGDAETTHQRAVALAACFPTRTSASP